MTLAKDDLDAIRTVVTEVTQPKFDEIEKRFDGVDKKFDEVAKNFVEVKEAIQKVADDLTEFATDLHQHHEVRIAALEEITQPA